MTFFRKIKFIQKLIQLTFISEWKKKCYILFDHLKFKIFPYLHLSSAPSTSKFKFSKFCFNKRVYWEVYKISADFSCICTEGKFIRFYKASLPRLITALVKVFQTRLSYQTHWYDARMHIISDENCKIPTGRIVSTTFCTYFVIHNYIPKWSQGVIIIMNSSRML